MYEVFGRPENLRRLTLFMRFEALDLLPQPAPKPVRGSFARHRCTLVVLISFLTDSEVQRLIACANGRPDLRAPSRYTKNWSEPPKVVAR